MVFLQHVLCAVKHRKPLRKYLQSGFTDSIRIYVAGGSGGHGLPKYAYF